MNRRTLTLSTALLCLGVALPGAAVAQTAKDIVGSWTLVSSAVAGNDLLIKIEHSTFPNWSGTDQKRTITLTGDEMKWTNPAGSAGGVVTLAFKRAPARTTN